MHVLQRHEALVAQQQGIAQVKPATQLHINPAAAAGFLPDCYFSRSLGCRPIFLTLNKVINSPSGHLTIAVGRLFGRQPILSSNDQIFSRCPAGRWSSGLPAVTAGSPVNHRSPQDSNESRGRLTFTYRWPVDLPPASCRFVYRIWLGYGINICTDILIY